MKLILSTTLALVFGCYLGDYSKGTTRYQQPIGQAKKAPITRYFLVGYRIETETKHATGNVQWFVNDGLMPVKAKVYEFLQKDLKNIEFSFNELVIIGLHEFKNKKDCEQFYNDQKIKP